MLMKYLYKLKATDLIIDHSILYVVPNLLTKLWDKLCTIYVSMSSHLPFGSQLSNIIVRWISRNLSSPKCHPDYRCRWYPWPLGAACTPAPLLWYDTCTGERTGSHCKKTSGFYVPHQKINPSRPIQCLGLGCLDSKFGLWVRKTVYTSYTPFGHW